MDELAVYIDKLSENVKTITEYYYQNNNQQALTCMPELLDNIIKMTGALELKEGVEQEDKEELVRIMTEALKAMEESDYVLLADILQYDMIDLLDKLKENYL